MLGSDCEQRSAMIENHMIYRVRVFLSWAGTNSRSFVVADGLHSWLQKVIHFAEPFISSDDILVGERWNGVLDRELASSDFGILCVTKRSLKSPWLLFEAGVLAGRYGSSKRVVPYLIDLGVEDLSPPLGQFNPTVANEQGTYKLIRSLNTTPDGKFLVPEPILKDTFKVWWKELSVVLDSARDINE